jgi:hypothetical protein
MVIWLSRNFRRNLIRDPAQMAVDQPFPRGIFKVELGPGEHEVSVIFKPTQSTIVFSIARAGELAPEYQFHHTRPGLSMANS